MQLSIQLPKHLYRKSDQQMTNHLLTCLRVCLDTVTSGWWMPKVMTGWKNQLHLTRLLRVLLKAVVKR